MDLGADTFTTFRRITFPAIRTALLAGGAARVRAVVRRDHRHELHVRTRAPRRCRCGSSRTTSARTTCPLVNVAAVFVLILCRSCPVYLASRLTTGTEATGRELTCRPRRGLSGSCQRWPA